MALIIQSDIEAWTGVAFDVSRAGAVAQAIVSAQAWIAREVGIRSLEKEAQPVTIYLDSANAGGVGGTDLWLPPDVRPFWFFQTDLLAIYENGVALSVSSGYTPSADVILRGANSLNVGMMWRPIWYPGTVITGRQNVQVSCKVGFDVKTGTNLPVPEDVRSLIMEVALLWYQIPGSLGRKSQSKAGGSESFDNELSPMAKRTLEWLRGVQ